MAMLTRVGDILQYSVGASAVSQLVSSSNSRVALDIFVDTGVGYVTDLPGQPSGTGIPVTPSSPLHLTQETHGDLVRHSFFGSSLSGTVVFGVIPIEETDRSKLGNM